MNIKLLCLDDCYNATILRFIQYQIQQWIFQGEKFVVFVGKADEILLYLRIHVLPISTRCTIYPSLSLSSIWSEIIREIHSNHFVSCSIYLNSFVLLEHDLQRYAELMRPNDRIITNSYFSYHTVKSLVKSFPNSTVSIDPVHIPKSYLTDDVHKQYVTLFCRPIRHKLIHYAINAFAKLDISHLTLIIGLLHDESEESILYISYLKELVYKHNIPCHFLHCCTRDVVSSYLQRSFANICLSSTFEETQGKILVEAAANNCIPIANVWNGFPEFIPDNRFLVATEFSLTDGVHVQPSVLCNAIKNAMYLYETNPDQYLKVTNSIHDTYCLNSKREVLGLTSLLSHYHVGSLPFYLELFSHGNVSHLLFDNVHLTEIASFSIDNYLYFRSKFNLPDSDQNFLSIDLAWLVYHANQPYTWSLLLEQVAWCCLTSAHWNSDQLRYIRDFVQNSGHYKTWVHTITSLTRL